MSERVRVKIHSGKREIEVEALADQIDSALSLVDQILSRLGPAERDLVHETLPSAKVAFSASGADSPPQATASKLPDALMQLLGSDWGRAPRTLREIAEALELNAMHYALPAISTALARLTKAGKVRRLKKGDVYSYVSAKR